MKQKILDRLSRLNAKLDTELGGLAQYNQEQLDQSPGDGQWSAMHALQHLKMAEGYSHQYIRKKLSFNPDLNKVGLNTAWRTMVMAAFFKSPIKRKAPDAVNTNAFPEGVTLEQLRDEWKAQRQDLYAYIEAMDDHWMNKEVYKHPFAGRLGLDGLLTFFEMHFDRHVKQAKRAVHQVSKV